MEEMENGHLKNFLRHLQGLQAEGTLPVEMDLNRFADDVAKGMYFDSSIPQGYGVGSSGALVAAIYSNYAANPIQPEDNIGKDDILTLKTTFGQLESYFHGKSSGVDPLICYLKLPVLIKDKTDLNTIGMLSGEIPWLLLWQGKELRSALGTSV